ncbi:hypothetical protein Ciccas_004685 [Cichlidogyrus casuarinus]|uniref:Ig-like domain-containing protein n=1 Tax=Cichlidogyrus casuarinus TaxID=1844966 RepID=A0ABD2QAX8_9PLAT
MVTEQIKNAVVPTKVIAASGARGFNISTKYDTDSEWLICSYRFSVHTNIDFTTCSWEGGILKSNPSLYELKQLQHDSIKTCKLRLNKPVPPILNINYLPPPILAHTNAPEPYSSMWNNACSVIIAFPPVGSVKKSWNEPSYAWYTIKKYFANHEDILPTLLPLKNTRLFDQIDEEPSVPVNFSCRAKNAVGETTLIWPFENGDSINSHSVIWPIIAVVLFLSSFLLVIVMDYYCRMNKRRRNFFVEDPRLGPNYSVPALFVPNIVERTPEIKYSNMTKSIAFHPTHQDTERVVSPVNNTIEDVDTEIDALAWGSVKTEQMQTKPMDK